MASPSMTFVKEIESMSRPRAEHSREGSRGEVRRLRRDDGRPGPAGAAAPAPPPPRSRPSSPSSSRSRLEQDQRHQGRARGQLLARLKEAKISSRTSAPSRKACRRTRPPRSRRSSRTPERRSRSSSPEGVRGTEVRFSARNRFSLDRLRSAPSRASLPGLRAA